MEKQLRTPIRISSLAKQIEDILDERINSGYYLPKAQLPAEDELAKEFDVSRATVRSALSSLTALGKVVRLHGVGTFVSQLPRISNPLDQLIDFQDLFARHGHQAEIKFVYCKLQEASSELASTLDIPKGSQVLVSEKIFTAGEAPAINCVNTIPASVLGERWLGKVMKQPGLLEPIFDFFETELDLRVAYMHARVYALTADQICFHASLPCEKTTPVLVLDEVAYTGDGKPVFHTYEYHPERRMNFELIRRRIS